MTKKLYDGDAYLKEFEATVISCKESDDGRYKVILDETCFFPEEGGQTPDKGKLNDIDVLDVQTKNGIITHYVDKPLEEGTQVKGMIDWEHRFSNMQQHSGEHIFSGLVHSTFGYDNVGFHLSDNVVTMDYNGVLSMEDVYLIEEKANDVIFRNIEIIPSFPSDDEIKNIEYRSKKEIDGQIRIVTIPGVDVCACCAPHVKRTGEIGILKVMSVQNYKGGVRLSILCGKRALYAFRKKNEVVASITGELSSSEDTLVDSIQKIKEKGLSYKHKFSMACLKNVRRELEEIGADEKNVILFEDGLETATIRNLVNEMVEIHEGICGIFNGSDEEGYSFILASKNIDMKDVAGMLREKTGAKGGGSSAMIQGATSALKKDITEILHV
ncbi:MAG: hypothetical protein K6E13_00325 [Lachnospiraceae bacterium]|nr:hypothetical protein [Lachnospiraceae bacterium]